MLPKPRQTWFPTPPNSSACRSSRRPAFANTTRAGCLGREINLLGVQALGLGLGTLIHELGVPVRIVVGHDYRSYSLSIKQALTLGLLAGGCEVLDIGLALSPMAYFAQFDLDAPCVAMVTASHNDNGWTGVKMGVAAPAHLRPRRDGRAEGDRARRRLPSEGAAGATSRRRHAPSATSPICRRGRSCTRPLKVVAACGNGTAGAFAPQVLAAHGRRRSSSSIASSTTPSPRTIRTPKTMDMLHAMREAVQEHGADLGLGFDGDGDRCGVVDNEGEEIFADKIGLMLARDLAARTGATFVVDVKSTGLFPTDPVLKQHGATTVYWKTGHCYIKRKSPETGALAGFEKSGHFFFNPPLGRGYDDGLVAGAAVLDMLDRNPGKKLSDLKNALPHTWQSLTMSPHCDDEIKYGVVDASCRISRRSRPMAARSPGRRSAS